MDASNSTTSLAYLYIGRTDCVMKGAVLARETLPAVDLLTVAGVVDALCFGFGVLFLPDALKGTCMTSSRPTTSKRTGSSGSLTPPS